MTGPRTSTVGRVTESGPFEWPWHPPLGPRAFSAWPTATSTSVTQNSLFERRLIYCGDADSRKRVSASSRFARASATVSPWLATSTSGQSATWPVPSRSTIAVNRLFIAFLREDADLARTCQRRVLSTAASWSTWFRYVSGQDTNSVAPPNCPTQTGLLASIPRNARARKSTPGVQPEVRAPAWGAGKYSVRI